MRACDAYDASQRPELTTYFWTTHSQETASLNILLISMLAVCIPALMAGSWSFPTPSLIHTWVSPPPTMLQPHAALDVPCFSYIVPLVFVIYMAVEFVSISWKSILLDVLPRFQPFRLISKHLPSPLIGEDRRKED